MTPAPGLLKKGGKDEKVPRLVATTLILSLTITEFYLPLNKQRAQEYTHTLGSRALRFTYLRGYSTIRTINHYLSSFPRKTCCRRSFLFNRFHSFVPLNLFLYGILNPPAERFALLNGLKMRPSDNARLHLDTF